MIKIKRSKKVPEILLDKGLKAKKELCDLYDKDPESEFKFNSAIYGHKEVKESLRKFQSDKCCFCESKVSHISYGDIEHFRPKAAYKNNKEETSLNKPGYYWLAYEWSNLLFSCEICNRRHKGNLFPLINTESRAKNHHSEIINEKPVFINPYEDNPSEHIAFSEEFAYGLTERGKVTIDSLDLNRQELLERRRRIYEAIKIINKASNSEISEISKESLNFIESCLKSSSEYSLMVKRALTEE